MAMGISLLFAALIVLPFFAGCLEPAESDHSSPGPRRLARTIDARPPAAGTMTGSVQADDVVVAMCGGLSFPPENAYCATRTIEIEGAIEDLPELPVSLATFVGDVDVQGIEPSEWNLTAVLSARGSSEDDARSNLDNIDFQWSHEDGDGHHLRATAQKKDQDTQNNEAARFAVRLPKSLPLYLDAATSVGDVTASDLIATQCALHSSTGDVAAQRVESAWMLLGSSTGDASALDFTADEVVLETSTGSITARGEAPDANVGTSTGDVDLDLKFRRLDVSTSTGDVTAKLTPLEGGSLTVDTSTGEIAVAVPEGAEFGYSIDAGTGTGSVSIELQDGQVAGDEEQAHFVTNNYSKRSIRVTADLHTSTRDITVRPA